MSSDDAVVEYEEADFAHEFSMREIHELKPAELAQVVIRIVKVEGPVHKNEIIRRVATLWRLQRAGKRIAESVKRALQFAVRHGSLEETERFFTLRGMDEFVVRSRENVKSAGLRKPEMLPPQEIDSAAKRFITAHISATPDETVRAVARQFGFRSTSSQLASRINARIAALVADGVLYQDRNVLRMSQHSRV